MADQLPYPDTRDEPGTPRWIAEQAGACSASPGRSPDPVMLFRMGRNASVA